MYHDLALDNWIRKREGTGKQHQLFEKYHRGSSPKRAAGVKAID
jgi:hypothetical protein